MYAGTALLLVGMPLWLSPMPGRSWHLLPIGVLMLRDRIRRTLYAPGVPGYAAYTEACPYRSFPVLVTAQVAEKGPSASLLVRSLVRHSFANASALSSLAPSS